MAEQLRVLILKDGDVFVAQCLEIDIAAQGHTEGEAIARLRAALMAELECAKEAGKSLADIGPAPKHFEMLFGAQVVNRTQLKMAA